MTIRSEPGRSDPGHGPADPGLGVIMSERRQLIGLTYRLLGSLAEAEDAVQETYARWYALSRQEQEAIESPGAWLTTVASRICLNLLGSARARRETYVGEWIPEPLPERVDWITGHPGGASPDPADRVTLDESVTMAFLVVLESMTPAERVALILHDVFRYSFAEVAAVTGRTPAACRQLASSARRRVLAAQAPPSPPARQADIIRAFKTAWEAKDIGALIGLLDPDATATADGGGTAPTFLHPIHGGEQIARAWVEIASNHVPGDVTFLERTVNGRPGLVAQQGGRILTVFAFDVAGDRIRHIWAVRNPDKLRRWTAVLADLLRAEPPLHEVGGHLPDPPVGLLRVAAHQVEGPVRRNTQLGRHDALGLLDDGPGGQRGVQVADETAAGAVNRRVADRRAALRGEKKRRVVRGAAERAGPRPVERDRARRLLVGTQRQDQAAAESGFRGGPAERRPAGLRRRVVGPARLVVAQRLDDRAFPAAELQVVQDARSLVGRGEGEPAVGRGDGHRRRVNARDELNGQGGQPPQRVVLALIRLQQLRDLSHAVGELPGHGHHGRMHYPVPPGLCA